MWNNRVWKETVKDCGDGVTMYSVRETFYNPAGAICGCNEGNTVREHSLEDLKESLGRYLRALEQPVLDLDGFKFADWNSK